MMAADLAGVGVTILVGGPLTDHGPLQSVAFSVLNMGDRRAPIGTRVRFYASRDAVLDSGDRALRDSVIPVPIRPSERVAYTKTIKFPAGMDDGTYRIIMRVDPTNQIAESDETNNSVFSAPKNISLPAKLESIEISKRYLRPGRPTTVTARNVTDMEASAGDVYFSAISVNRNDTTLLGTGTRTGNGYVLTFAPDRAWMTDTMIIQAIAAKHGGGGSTTASYKQLTIETRNAGPTIGSMTYSTSITRGQSTTITASALSSDVLSIGVYFDSNFDGKLQYLYVTPAPFANADFGLGFATAANGSASISFVVPDWFPSVPARVFVVAYRRVGTFDLATRAYPIFLNAH
jgi:hypothetical protein